MLGPGGRARRKTRCDSTRRTPDPIQTARRCKAERDALTDRAQRAGLASLGPVAAPDAVLLLSFGGPEGPDDVRPFLENVTRGRGVPPERLDEVAASYHAMGGISPINAQCRRFRDALATTLTRNGHDLPVYWGNRNWHPYVDDTVAQMAADGIQRALVFVTSAYSSYSGCRQYLEDLDGARSAVGPSAPVFEKLRAYYDHPGFVEPLAVAGRALLGEFPASPHLLFTAHSIPTASAATCDYEAQLAETARLVAMRIDPELPWSFAWQSRSGPPQVPWLEPSVDDQLTELAMAGVTDVLVVPAGFVSDHMEVVWDLDHEAAATAERLGLRMRRATTPGTAPEPAFVDLACELIEERLDASRGRRALGALGVRPDMCPADCCPPPARPTRR